MGPCWEATWQGRVGWILTRLSSVPAFLGEPLASCHAEGGGGGGGRQLGSAGSLVLDRGFFRSEDPGGATLS